MKVPKGAFHLVQTVKQRSDKNSQSGPEVGEGPRDVDRQLGHLFRGGVHVDDGKAEETAGNYRSANLTELHAASR